MYLHVCRITWMNIPMTVQITLVCGRLWRTKQERKEVTSAYRKWWTRGSYRWDIRLSQSTSTDKVEVRKSHKNISWWLIQKSLILNTLHHLGKVDANYIADWSCLHLCMGLLCFNSSFLILIIQTYIFSVHLQLQMDGALYVHDRCKHSVDKPWFSMDGKIWW